MSRVALVQVQSSTNKEENLKTTISYVKKARSGGAELAAFPEFLMAYTPSSQSAAELAKIAESLDGPFTTSLRNAAKDNSISIVATIHEKSTVKNRVYDTAFLIDKKGNLSTVYRKLHLYDALGFKESKKFVEGKELARPIKSNVGMLGLMICYDVRFPEMSRMLTVMGANVLVMPSAWVQGEMKVDHWQTMLKARAIENGCYVIAPDQVGNIYVGHSMVVDPFGRILIDMEERQGVEFVDLDLKAVEEIRKKLPLLKNRRKDLYAKYLKK